MVGKLTGGTMKGTIPDQLYGVTVNGNEYHWFSSVEDATGAALGFLTLGNQVRFNNTLRNAITQGGSEEAEHERHLRECVICRRTSVLRAVETEDDDVE